jgi:DNA-binding response OmpR family regulator
MVVASEAAHVLVVDDEPAIRALIGHILANAGYCCCEAHNGETMQSKIRSEQFDLVILDLDLGLEDGLILLRQMRSWCQVPVLVVSGRSAESDRLASLQFGANSYLEKPFQISDMLRTVAHLTDRSGNQD